MRHAFGAMVILAAALCASVPGGGAIAGEAAVVIRGHGELTVSGPHVHGNLAVYIFHAGKAGGPETEYITLEEGVGKGLVKVTEADRAEVGQLLVTNLAKLPLYLQVGELVRGGKQDRTLRTSLVIPPETPDVPIPAFCVQQGRWPARGGAGPLGTHGPP